MPRVPVSGDWLATLRAGDRISVIDTRGAPRHLTV
jgi:hypothetical protein